MTQMSSTQIRAQNCATERELGRLWIRNIFRNYLRLQPDETRLNDTSGGARPGNAQDNARPGNAQDNARPGNAQDNARPGNAQDGARPGNAQDGARPGNAQDGARPGNAQDGARPGNAQDNARPGNAQDGARPGNARIHSFTQMSTSLPVILIGAGISLEAHIDTITHLQSTHCIVAVDTALPILRMHNINPDIVFALESQIYNLRDFLSGIDQNTIVALDITSHPSLLRIIHDSPVALYASMFANISLLKLLAEKEILPTEIETLGSVGIVALYLSLLLTKKEIYVLGIDFSYRMGKTHCRGAPFLSSMMHATHMLNPDPLYAFCALRAQAQHICMDKNGHPTRSEPTLMNSNNILQHICSSYQRIYDCGDEGLYFTDRIINIDELPLARDAHSPPRPCTPNNTRIVINYDRQMHNNPTAIARTLMSELHILLRKLLSLDLQDYHAFLNRKTTDAAADGAGRILTDNELAKLDFLIFGRGDIPSAQHYRYSALDYYHRLTRYLHASS